jgi:hypothetical protein
VQQTRGVKPMENVPEHVETTIMRALSVERSQRPDSAADFAASLNAGFISTAP